MDVPDRPLPHLVAMAGAEMDPVHLDDDWSLWNYSCVLYYFVAQKVLA